MAPITPYSKFLGDREPIQAIRDNIEKIRSLTTGWSTGQFERTYAPGKWTARQILTHLAQTELAFGTRIRMALTVPNYVAQSFDQNNWLAREATLSGRDATDTLLTLGNLNIALFASLSTADRAIPFSHPEYGSLTVDWIIHTAAGHQINHVQQLEQIAA
jgi:hypothetical protein